MAMKHSAGRRWLGLILLVGAALHTQAAEPPAPPPPREGAKPIASADRRFLVSGLSSAENLILAQELSEMARQIEEITGMTLPMRRDQILRVIVQQGTDPSRQLMKVQGWEDGQFYQRLLLPGRAYLDTEDMREAVCWLLLNRYAAEYTPAAGRTGMGAVIPDWIAAGVAQNTQTAIKSRNRDWLARELADGRFLPLASVVKQEYLPSGRWREKAYAAAAVEFLFPPGDRNHWAVLFQAVGTRQVIDAAWLRRNSPALRDRNPEETWRTFLEQRVSQPKITAWSDRALLLEERLLQTLNFRPRDYAAEIPAEVPLEMFARDLIEYRHQPWVPSAAAALQLRIQSLQLGAPTKLQEVLSRYAAFFEFFTRPPEEKSSRRPRIRKSTPGPPPPPDDATWQLGLNHLWRRAEKAHQEFLEQYQTRKQFVDSFDQPIAGDWQTIAPAAEIPRTPIQKYLDEWESAAPMR